MKRIRRKFLQLTSFTYPHGTEHMLEKHLPKGYKVDEFGNYYIQIGEEPTSLFTCHLDTACSTQERVKHTWAMEEQIIGTDGTTILGADDKAGMIVVLNMIENKIPGLYYFFLGEEVGCIGSKKVASVMSRANKLKINKVVSFDRKGFESIITHQYAGRCASDKFAENLASELNKHGLKLRPDDTGVCTDSIQFQEFISECTNISVGYFHEHTGQEVQNIKFLKILCDAVVKVDWQNLPTFRDPFEIDYEQYMEDEEEEFGFQYDGPRTFSPKYFTYTTNKEDGSRKQVFISNERIGYEMDLIDKILSFYGLDTNTMIVDWNGDVLSITDKQTGQITETPRTHLSKMHKEFLYVDPEDLKYDGVFKKTRRSNNKKKEFNL